MKHRVVLWIFAVLITLAAVVFQRMTGPTYPVRGKTELNGIPVSYTLNRSHSGFSDDTVKICTGNPAITGTLKWKRYKTTDAWTAVDMKYTGGLLTALLPYQPPAGKLLYTIDMKYQDSTVTVPQAEPVIIRFKGEVPLWVLILHIIIMFAGMLLSMRCGLEFFSKEPSLKTLTWLTIISLFIGGLILGPIVQWYAFGELWTGWPYGTDLTDNKTLIAFIGWLAAITAVYRSKRPKWWVLAAALILLIVYLIPHSLFGSELDYKV